MKPTKSGLSKSGGTLDRLWRSVGKDGAFCEICATLPPGSRIHYTQLHPHHILLRKHKATRWDLRNRLWVCPYHHTIGKYDETVQDNIGGWFLNWESDNDWMGQHRKNDKEYLREFRHVIKKWTLDELMEIYNELRNPNAYCGFE